MTEHRSRLIYRKPTPADLPRLFDIYGDPRTHLFNPAGPLTSLAQAESVLSRWLEHWSVHGYGWWAVATDEAPDQVIGFGGIALHDYLGEQRVNLGYRFAEHAWGKGLATQLGKAGLAHAFESLHLPQVYGLVRPAHAASIKVLEKIGMQRIGVLDEVPGQAPSLVFRARAHG
ncbi:GNAT family N-acetyltransferase [Pseudomonas viridiflava]|uniref:N-acetyltransferase domain-containing protein n=1 Tax=Pseudomonas viridiflava TaxID=33069 RepID=A0A3M5PI98_PSEVI|nr:GNAT family N-acetyltransferase [Pseudomonas viridiflava]MBA1228673.1 GNAT family N-acetyltransferase [Pseudomonas viridiflava]RMT83813.1 hypothetical protein ALP40_02701 [Pseudomonas viridiflava]